MMDKRQRENLIRRLQMGMPSAFGIQDPVARQAFDTLRQIVLLLVQDGEAAGDTVEAVAVAAPSYEGDGSVVVDEGVIRLVNDSANPGAVKIYGTDVNGNKGWFNAPLGGGGGGGSVDVADSVVKGGDGKIRLDGDASSPGTNKVYGTGTDGVKGWKDAAVVEVKESIEKDTDGKLRLVNDAPSPGNDKVYGTNGSGAKGWKDEPSLTEMAVITGWRYDTASRKFQVKRRSVKAVADGNETGWTDAEGSLTAGAGEVNASASQHGHN